VKKLLLILRTGGNENVEVPVSKTNLGYDKSFFFFFFFVLISYSTFPIRLSGLFPTRINLKAMDLTNSRVDSLDGRSALSKARYLYRTTQTQKKLKHTSVPLVEFEPTIAVFEGVKIFHILDCAATVIGIIVTKYTD
jgi:hypothetical protein